MRIQDFKLLLLLQFVVLIQATTKSVYLYTRLGQLVTSNTLGWQSFYDDFDEKQLKYGVEASKIQADHGNSTLYVCRATVDGISVSGHTLRRDQRTFCVVTMHTNVGTHHAFDILLNKGDGGKLTWTKSSGVIPPGAISASSSGHVSVKRPLIFCLFIFRLHFECEDRSVIDYTNAFWDRKKIREI